MSISAAIQRYDRMAIGLHWLMVILIVVMYGLGWYMVDLPKGDARHLFFTTHKSIGLTVAMLALFRLFWRQVSSLPGRPRGMPRWKWILAEFTHGLLYAMMFLQPVSGYVSSSFSGYKTRYFGIPLPQWGWKDPVLNELFTELHVICSIVLLGLIIVHVLAALSHLLVFKDGVFQRMWPGLRGGSQGPGSPPPS